MGLRRLYHGIDVGRRGNEGCHGVGHAGQRQSREWMSGYGRIDAVGVPIGLMLLLLGIVGMMVMRGQRCGSGRKGGIGGGFIWIV